MTAAQQEMEPIATEVDGNLYFVGQGIGGGSNDPWFTMKRRALDKDSRSSRRVKSKNLPDRMKREEAQADLDAYALKHGLEREGRVDAVDD